MPARPKRPLRLTLAGLLILATALWNGVRLEQSLFFGKTLAEYHLRPGPAYVAVSGGIWLATGLILIVGLWTGRRWSGPAGIAAVCAYAAWYWFDRLVLQVLHLNWPFSLAATFVLLFLALFALGSPKTARFLRQKEAYERQSKSQAAA
jgi:formate hydrogenlyase subunit 3/multisubunit Na+/H+ antiporter MnhD subunit